jgi:tryptophan synthase beta chain
LLHRAGVVEAVNYNQLRCFEAAVAFARAEGIIVAPETSHAVACAIDEALKAKHEGVPRTIVFCLSGHGHLDLASYERYFSGELQDFEYPLEKIKESLAHLPKVGAV